MILHSIDQDSHQLTINQYRIRSNRNGCLLLPAKITKSVAENERESAKFDDPGRSRSRSFRSLRPESGLAEMRTVNPDTSESITAIDIGEE
jgi:hypothetical protein